MYFGIVIGIMFSEGRKNIPNTKDVWIGKRINNILYIHTEKLVRKGTQEIKYAGRLIPLIDTEVSIFRKHFNWQSPIHIVDEDWGSDIIGVQQKYSDKALDTGTEIDIEAMDKEVKETIEKAKKEGKTPNIKLNINPIFQISAVKLYNWFYVKMLNAAYDAIVKKGVIKGGSIGLIILGIVMGGMGGYIATNYYNTANPHIITVTINNSCPTDINLSQTTITYSGLSSECISSILAHTNSTLTTSSTSTTQSSSTATVIAISSFNNGTVLWQYSNGSKICKANC